MACDTGPSSNSPCVNRSSRAVYNPKYQSKSSCASGCEKPCKYAGSRTFYGNEPLHTHYLAACRSNTPAAPARVEERQDLLAGIRLAVRLHDGGAWAEERA